MTEIMAIRHFLLFWPCWFGNIKLGNEYLSAFVIVINKLKKKINFNFLIRYLSLVERAINIQMLDTSYSNIYLARMQNKFIESSSIDTWIYSSWSMY